MVRNLILTAVALAASVSSASAQAEPFSGYRPAGREAYAPRAWRNDRVVVYEVQFRQPEWREQVFTDPTALTAFVQDKRVNGWQLETRRIGRDEYVVRFRLPTWGGSKVFSTRREAEAWADQLEEEQGFQTRIVPKAL
jgi:hypothetical protein